MATGPTGWKQVAQPEWRGWILAAWTYVAASRRFDERTKENIPEFILGRNAYDEMSELRRWGRQSGSDP